MKIASFIISVTYLLAHTAALGSGLWSVDAKLPGKQNCFITHNKKVCHSDGNRKNIFSWPDSKLNESLKSGSTHALFYPVTVSELQVPYQSILDFFESSSQSPLRNFVYKIIKSTTKFKDLDQVYKWVGLHHYPKKRNNTNLIYNIHKFDRERMGVTISNDSSNTKQLTFGCAACHSSNLFGEKVLGMSNRFPRANEFFIHGKNLLSLASPLLYKALVKPSKEEMKVFKKSKNAIKYIKLKKPLALGLDTSLAQVGLSLSKRAKDDVASRRIINSRFPRKNKLNSKPADSKPAVWWNLKYKTKFLSDGSLRSGNPVHTNFLWNEIGRGTDLKKLEKWLLENQTVVDDLTSYVFNTTAPKYNSFFPNELNITKAKRGEALFKKNCMACHGNYEKGWSNPSLSYEEQIKTTKTWYHTRTITIDVKTDPHRYEGMSYFYQDLNRLKISKSIGTLVEPQKGYVPPPLEGIWSRWPYFHNNSAPTLYDVLTPDYKRPKTYYSREAISKEHDFDKVKNGYPNKANKKKYFYNTKVKGLSNMGHTFMLLNKDGSEKFSHQQKLEIIEFLKTL